MAPDDGAALELRAEDAEDLAVISACLQDALVAVRDLAYDPEDRSFLLVANRFRWEAARRDRQPARPFRAHPVRRSPSARSTAVSYRGFRRSEEDRILSSAGDPAGTGRGDDRPRFSGGAAIRLDVVGDPLPRHAISASPGRPHGSPITTIG